MKREARVDKKYSPADICAWFEIPRTTLFRWEETGDISEADRGQKGERVYSRRHLKQIATKVKTRISEEVDYCVQYTPSALCPAPETLERLYKANFFISTEKEQQLEELTGLAQRKQFSPQTIRALIEEAYQRPVGDSVRSSIWRLLLIHDEASRGQ
jgi:DNA-binding transcriptional MerR regulator